MLMRRITTEELRAMANRIPVPVGTIPKPSESIATPTDGAPLPTVREADILPAPPFPSDIGADYHGMINWHGLPIAIENARWSTRSGVGPEGAWNSVMPDHYGEVLGTTGNDGDAIDVFVGRDHGADLVYVIAITHPDGSFDEVKCMLDYSSIEDAYRAFENAYDNGMPEIVAITPWPVPQFVDRIQQAIASDASLVDDWRRKRARKDLTKSKFRLVVALTKNQLDLFGGKHLVPKRVTVAAHTRSDGTPVGQYETTVYTHPEEPKAADRAPAQAETQVPAPTEETMAPVSVRAAEPSPSYAIPTKPVEASAPVVAPTAKPVETPPERASLTAKEATRLKYKEIIDRAAQAQDDDDTKTLDVLRAEVERRNKPVPDVLHPKRAAESAPTEEDVPVEDPEPMPEQAHADEADVPDLPPPTIQTDDPTSIEPTDAPAGPDSLITERELAEPAPTPENDPILTPSADEVPDANPPTPRMPRARAPAKGARPLTSPAAANDSDAHNHDVGEVIVGARKHDAATRMTVAQYRTALQEQGISAVDSVTRTGVIGTHNPEADRQAGVTAGASWLKAKIRGMIDKSPAHHLRAEAYIEGAEFVARQLDKCQTVSDIYAWVRSQSDMFEGVISDAPRTLDELREMGFNPFTDATLVQLNAEHTASGYGSDVWKKAHADVEAEWAAAGKSQTTKMSSYKRFNDDVMAKWNAHRSAIRAKIVARQNELKNEHGKIAIVGHATIIPTAIAEKLGYVRVTPADGGRVVLERIVDKSDQIIIAHKDRMTALGNRFVDSLIYGTWMTNHRTSPTALHATWRKSALETEKANDWSWAGEKVKEAATEAAGGTEASKVARTRFDRKVRDASFREGGRPTPDDVRGEDLISTFGLRAVQHGNYVNDEHASIHLKHAHGALNDLSDMLGISPSAIAQGGVLGLAFGARGKGNTGFTGAAAAHYEGQTLAINITRDNGRGTLAHEYGHFLDHLLAGYVKPEQREGPEGTYTINNEASVVTSSGPRAHFLSEGDIGPSVPPAVADAIDGVMAAIQGNSVEDHRALESLTTRRAYLQRQIADSKSVARTTGRMSWEASLAASSAKRELKRLGPQIEKMEQRMTASRAGARFMRDAVAIAPYYARNREMFARCFESYVEDELVAHGRTSTYLVDGTRERYQMLGFEKTPDGQAVARSCEPYPQGDERVRIHGAMKGLIEALRTTGHLAKSLDDLAASRPPVTRPPTRFRLVVRA